MEGIIALLVVASGALLIMVAIPTLAGRASLNSIKSRTVGDGQYGTARWATAETRLRDFTMPPNP